MPDKGYDLPTRKLVSQQDSAMIARPDVPRSKFQNAYTRKTTFDAGLLVPFLVDEVLPGDNLSYNVTAYVRMATPFVPMMDNQKIDTHFFFVPNRLVWQNWRQFMGEQANPSSSIAFTIPQVVTSLAADVALIAPGTLWDYFGLPTSVSSTVGNVWLDWPVVNALPFRAYNLIYNEWYRDENLINSLTVPVGDGPDNPNIYAVRRRAKMHDYFTSALPWPQKFTAPSLGSPVHGIGIQALGTLGATAIVETPNPVNPSGFGTYNNAADNAASTITLQTNAGGTPQVFAETSINSFRQAIMIQSLLERDARGGTRYTEIVRSHFGVISPDARLQRPEFIGGGTSPINITPVAQTAPTEGRAVGVLGGAGTAVGQHRASYAATEHGYIIGILSVRSELSYSRGVPRLFDRRTRYDFYWPSLAQLGEQAILRREIYATGLASNDDVVFGYQERWHEYRTRYSEITGLFRPNVTGNIAFWHVGQNFSTAPTLGQTFIEDNPPMDRVLAAGEQAVRQQYLADLLIQRTAVRPIPMYGTPATLGRF